MATTENFVFGDGGDTYSFSFPYLKTEDVRVELQEYDATQPAGDRIISRSSISAFTIPAGNPTQIIFNAIGADTVYQTAPDGDVKVTSTNGYPVRIRIYRVTAPDATPATFFAGSAIRAQDLNDNFDQILYIMQEKENALISIQTGGIGDNVISTSAIQDDAVDATKLRDSVSVDSNRAVTTNHIRDNAVTTAKLASNLTIDLASGTAGLPSLTFDANTGLYRPGAGQVAISTNGTQRLLIDSSGNVKIDSNTFYVDATNNRVGLRTSSPEGTLNVQGDATSPSLTYDTDNIANFDAGGIQFAVGIDSSSPFGAFLQARNNADGAGVITLNPAGGNVGIGTTSPSNSLHVFNSTSDVVLKVESGDTISRIELKDSAASNYISTVGANLDFAINGVAAAMRINSSGNVGIGTTSPAALLDVNGAGLVTNLLIRNNAGTPTLGTTPQVYSPDSGALAISANSFERLRIDSSGRLLVGASIEPTAGDGQYGKLVVQGYIGGDTGAGYMAIARGQQATAPFNNTTEIGRLAFTDSLGNSFAYISSCADGDTGSGDYPGRLVFSTTADGASSPTPRMTITSDAEVLIGTTDPIQPSTSTQNGVEINANAKRIKASRADGAPLTLQRTNSDGELIVFYQDTIQEGSIEVQGDAVSLNGAHLSRWSQLPGGAERTEILRGTVLSNIDEMCEWGDEDNEQLNRMKVSDVEGDKNVSGVFQSWDDDDDIYTNDFHCAMTGDFVIRIAQGVTVERGDLLMSAGDGTAKAQDDDIIRSKTIAKVTSTHVSKTYADGSYCVPCVLMAC